MNQRKDTIPLDHEEKQILEAFKSGQIKSIDDLKSQIKKHQNYAKATLDKYTPMKISSTSGD